MTIDAEMLKAILNHERVCFNDWRHAEVAQVKGRSMRVIVDRYNTALAQAEEAIAQALERNTEDDQ